MRPQIPPVTTPALDGSVTQRHWYRFFQELWESLGWNPSRPVYSSVHFPAFASVTSGSTAAIDTGLFVLVAADSANTFFNYSVRLPEEYKEGTDVRVYLEWLNASAASGNVVWRNVYGVGAPGDVLNADVTEDATITAGAEDTLTRSLLETISGSLLEKGSLIVGAVTRRGSDAADTLAGNAGIIGLTFEFRREGVGTETP